ncbi:hypothetical protein [Bacillus velezensis]|uniref:hypothetical protein n=1 Tax=Bacillus velezensis TaxID=492670 RepID=UPI001E630333|nr:hypothetical protein [Bacillus velezensis]GJJ27765.1 hypothetical protein BVN1_35290 [Bacillus velezensis]
MKLLLEESGEYLSFTDIFFAAYLGGTGFHDNEDGYCVDHLDIWVCEKKLFSGIAGYLSDLESDEEIAIEIQNRINEVLRSGRND